MKKLITALVLLEASLVTTFAQVKHAATSQFPSYEGRVMCGYQGWFRAPGDGADQGWGHYALRGKFDAAHVHLDFWPDVSEYPQTYPTALTNQNGETARVFSSWDDSTTDLHFHWMQQYGIDGAFVQRFFGETRTAEGRIKSRAIISQALKASKKIQSRFSRDV